MSSIVIKGNTSGQIELAAPDVAGSTTLTLPTGTGTVITTDNIDSNPPASLSTATGSAPSYSARVWLALDATSGTPVITGQGNISSITDNGVGDYTLNFTTAMPDAEYSLVMSVRRGAARIFWTSTLSSSSARVIAANLSQVQQDEAMSVAIFR